MNEQRARSLGAPSIVLLLALGACSGGSHGAASGVLPSSGSAFSPMAKATPPVTAPVVIPYPYTSTTITKTYASANAKPKTSKSVDNGLITVKFSIDKKTGVYFVPEIIASKTQGYTESLYSAIGFQKPPSGGGIAQIIFSDNYSLTQGPFSETGMDTYPATQNSFDFPLKTNRVWSAASAHNSFFNEVLTGKGAFEENVTSNTAADGTYTNQTSFSSTTGSANQDNYASTAGTSLTGPSVYTYAAPAAGFNAMTQSFALPTSKSIAVTTSGTKPIPAKAGTVNVKNWYPNGSLGSALYADNYTVTGQEAMPSTCGKWTGKTATHVAESNPSLDPVAGTYSTAAVDYYMAQLRPGQYWFVCIVENITATTYANGWFMNAGSWGTPSQVATTTEVLIASGAKPDADAIGALPLMHVFEFVPPSLLHARVARLNLRTP